MPLYGATKLLNASKVVLKMTYKKIFYNSTKEYLTVSRCETEIFEENSGGGNDEQSDHDNDQSDHNNGKHGYNDSKNDVISAKNSFRFTVVDSSIDLLTKQFGNPLLNADVQISSLKMEYKSLQDNVKENYKTKKYGLYYHVEKHISFGSY